MISVEQAKTQVAGKSAAELRDFLAAEQRSMADHLEKNTISGASGKVYNFDGDGIKRLQEQNDALSVIGQALEVQVSAEGLATKAAEYRLREAEQAAAESGRKGIPFPVSRERAESGEPVAGKTAGQMFVESAAYQAAVKAGDISAGRTQMSVQFSGKDFDALKTTMTRAAGFAPANDRTSILVPYATRRPVVQEFIPQITTDLDSIKFMEETTFTNNVAETAENAALPESALAYTERSQPVETIGTFLPVTEQQLEIAESIRGMIDQRLMLMYDLKEEAELLVGDGNTPNLLGFLSKSGIQTQAKGSDPVPDTIYKLITKLRGGGGSGFVEPTAVIMHPNDWQDIRILRDANGNYIWGPPSEPGPERIWGKTIVPTTAITENTALTGDFQMYSQIWRKRAARIDVGMQNDDFVKLKLTIRVSGRLALVIYRAAAFGTATGI